ncbi:MAG: anthranilate phosphoribosyltransferase [Gammaproteobacteria bacterium]|nr:anthranilate phosphoribosyltransferase [Gammaproteobacteria bacterium]
MRDLLERLLEREDLAESEARDLLGALTSPDLAPALAGALLAALRAKGVSAAELRGFAGALRARALRPQLPAGPPAVDIVGTGGDRSGSLNLSTGAALLTAAAGQRVVKHGNRSVSSRAGAADVLEQLGLTLPLDEVGAGRCLAATGFTFLFAPYYHPAMRSVAPVRQALGVRTVFNILGPLSNPAEPAFHVIGAYSSATAALMANALSGMPLTRAFVVHGTDGWDEPTPVGPFELYDVRPGQVQRTTRTPGDYGLARCRSAELIGGDAASNAAALRGVLAGREHGPHRDALLLGAALALEVCGQVDGPAAGMARAARAIDTGAAAGVLEGLARFGRGEPS